MSHQAWFRLSGLAIGTLSATLAASTAYSAAIERAIPSTTRILFEEGAYVEFGVSYIDPDQSGEDGAVPPQFGGPIPLVGNTGDLFDSHWSISAAWKNDITPNLSYAVFFDQPYGADTNYGPGTFPGGVPYDNSSADLNSYQITGVLAYDVMEQFKVYAGLRAHRLDAEAALPFVGPPFLPLPDGYTVRSDKDWAYGYLVGAAYSRPEIALRVALTYYSKLDHELSTTELDGVAIPGLQDGPTTTDVSLPQSVALEFQTGVAPDTLVFGSVRWVDWSDFTIAPPTYTTVLQGRPLVAYDDDWWTYNLGVGRRLTDKLAGSLSVTHEPDVGGELTTLGPYDGRTTVTAALSYDHERFNVTGGLTYGKLGDTFNVLGTDYNDGSIWGAGLRIGYSF